MGLLEIEEIRGRLENKLGLKLLNEVYDCVATITDYHTVKLDFEKIHKHKRKLENKYSVDEINAANYSTEEMFSIEVKERLCNELQ